MIYLPIDSTSLMTQASVAPASLTGAQACDDPLATPDEGASFIFASNSVANVKVRAGAAALPAAYSTGIFLGVTVHVRFIESMDPPEGIWQRSGKLHIYTSVTQYDGLTWTVSNDVELPYDARYTWATNPFTGARWTYAEINALEFGWESTEFSTNQSLFVTQMGLLVEHLPLAGDAELARQMGSMWLRPRLRPRRLTEAS